MASDAHCTTRTQKPSVLFTVEMMSAGHLFRVSQYVCVDGAPVNSDPRQCLVTKRFHKNVCYAVSLTLARKQYILGDEAKPCEHNFSKVGGGLLLKY